MSSENSSTFPLLKPVSLNVLQEIEYSETLLEAHAKIQGRNCDIVLVDDLIMVYSNQEDGSIPLGFVRLDFSLKFQRITLTKNFNERELKGFKLINDFNQTISFFIEFPNLTNLWISHLSKMINQSGFHNFYKPIRTLGKGSFATVYEIVRLDDGERFAAKVFSKENIKNNRSKMRSFINELEILRYIEHQNLLKLEGVFESEHSFYVIMQTLGGGNLFEYLTKRRTSFTHEQIKKTMRSILKGLEQLEKNNIVHRDIKLENLMLRDKNNIQPVIVDFGLAIHEDDEDYVYYQCGTPGYLSPQVLTLKKGQKITSKSDVFSAGVVLHVLLSGRYLFEGKNPKQVFQNNKLMNFNLQKPQYEKHDKSLTDLMKQMLEKDPSKRLFASQCLKHVSLRLQNSDHEQKFQISPTSTNSDYQF